MAFVITDNCNKDYLCVAACPVDCIHPREDEENSANVTQLYVHPEECIDCGACLPECGYAALFPEDEVPADKKQFIGINAAYYA